jgi:hypothetical protein
MHDTDSDQDTHTSPDDIRLANAHAGNNTNPPDSLFFSAHYSPEDRITE